jgi:hypothetical protein
VTLVLRIVGDKGKITRHGHALPDAREIVAASKVHENGARVSSPASVSHTAAVFTGFMKVAVEKSSVKTPRGRTGEVTTEEMIIKKTTKNTLRSRCVMKSLCRIRNQWDDAPIDHR